MKKLSAGSLIPNDPADSFYIECILLHLVFTLLLENFTEAIQKDAVFLYVFCYN